MFGLVLIIIAGNVEANELVEVVGHTGLTEHGGQVEIFSDGYNTSLMLRPDGRAFAAGYTETIIRGNSKESRIHDRSSCHYSGWSDTGKRVVASVCGKNGFRAIIGTPGMTGTKEIQYLSKEARHILIEDAALPLEGSGFMPRFVENDETRRQLRSGECGPEGGDWSDRYRATKFMGLIAINDAARVAAIGHEEAAENTAIAFAAIFDIYASQSSGVLDADLTFGGLKGDGSIFGCDMRALLTGQISYEDTNPDQLEYAEGTQECNACCQGLSGCQQSCSEFETSSLCLLESLGDFADDIRDDLISISTKTSDHDAIILISGTDFDSSTQGLAYVGGMCRRNAAAGVVSSFSSNTATRLATVTAHEIGHLLGMEHDQVTDDVNSNLMAASFRGSLDPQNLAFSDESRQYAAEWFSSIYGESSSVPACLDDVVQSLDDEDVITTCGDGIVQENEQCDPGLGINDDCCTDSCTLEPGCECALSEACCNDQGQIADAGTVCRANIHDTCDLTETCNGISASCPRDLFAITGTECVSDISGLEGVCYRGNCFAESDTCFGFTFSDGTAADIVCRASSCSTVGCREAGGSLCSIVGAAQDGTPCDSDKICVGVAFEQTLGLVDDDASECVPYDEARFFHWTASAANPCFEEPTCHDETGELAEISNCDPDLKPALPGFCTTAPSISPAPTSTTSPSRMPTIAPTASPTSTPAPTLLPTARIVPDDDSSSRTHSVFRAIQRLGFMHKVAVVIIIVSLLTCCCLLCGWRRSRSEAKYQQPSTEPPTNPGQPLPEQGRPRGTGSNASNGRLPSSRRPYAVSRTHNFSPVEHRHGTLADAHYVDDYDNGLQAQMVPPRGARNGSRPPPPDYSPYAVDGNHYSNSSHNNDGGFSLHSAYSV